MIEIISRRKIIFLFSSSWPCSFFSIIKKKYCSYSFELSLGFVCVLFISYQQIYLYKNYSKKNVYF